ncbi:DUF3800 domain-containing protein [Streptomyces glomeratus]|uniref:Uncharacterized protein n=1 Tax=Streptomyces glomeratus TaxID=284452 RepID=A0ABP6LHZ4_9ACTN|nr:DUF3800 domain-containing protein [Streptomyces glomeratus]MCF1510697.1 DUF3800 domain-containing protein [Streptomyces glomeratus]
MTRDRDSGVRTEAAIAPREVACDESGSDGENLTSGNTDVFAHASVHLPLAAAAGHVQEIRDRIRSPAEEYKATHLLRDKHRSVLEWLLGASGPLYGHAHVLLVEKSFFVVERVVDLLLGDPAPALPLFRAGGDRFGDEQWRRFLAASNDLVRARSNGEPDAPVEAFFRTVDAMRRARPHDDLGEVLALLGRSRERALAHRARITRSPSVVPVLNPLVPAIVRTAAYWGGGGHPVSLVHDEQNVLTAPRIAWLTETTRIVGFRLVDSRRDARVQLADFLAGTARKIASDELNGRGDPVLTSLLRPYVGGDSLWGDERSGALLMKTLDRANAVITGFGW